MAVTPAARPVAVVLRALGLGDLLTAVPALRALRRGLPDHEIVLAAPAPLAALVPVLGAVDRLLALPGLVPVPQPFPRPAVAVNLHGRGPESHGVLRALRPATLMSFAHPAHPGAGGPHAPAWQPEEHEVARWCRLVAAYGFRPDPAGLDLLPPPAPSPLPGVVIVHPGAKHAARRWPAARFAAVAAALRADGHRVVVTGSREEGGLARSVALAAGLAGDDVLAGRTDLAALAAVVAGARLVICGDTGIAHLATACRTPSVVLFGPVPPALWGPPPSRPRHVALWAGRRGSPLGAGPDPGLLEIGVADVLAAAGQALAAAGAKAVP
ncbi:MAG TPA: glycosyltransferase family 9 protein [Streptosporangiaceae bacterium]|nr:glycosyltransferase family 9 protein [Streptosporangiaceae bacterium]